MLHLSVASSQRCALNPFGRRECIDASTIDHTHAFEHISQHSLAHSSTQVSVTDDRDDWYTPVRAGANHLDHLILAALAQGATRRQPHASLRLDRSRGRRCRCVSPDPSATALRRIRDARSRPLPASCHGGSASEARQADAPPAARPRRCAPARQPCAAQSRHRCPAARRPRGAGACATTRMSWVRLMRFWPLSDPMPIGSCATE